MPRVDSLRKTVKDTRPESKHATSLRNKTKKDSNEYNNPEFWENYNINNDGNIIESKAFDFGEASARFEKFKNQPQSKGGKRKSRKQRNKSRKQKR